MQQSHAVCLRDDMQTPESREGGGGRGEGREGIWERGRGKRERRGEDSS